MNDLINNVKVMSERNKNHNDILRYLQREGCSLIQSVMIIKQALKLSMEQAREIVLNSDCWTEAIPLSNELFNGFTDSADSV